MKPNEAIDINPILNLIGLKGVINAENISDGYHSFKELYQHRLALNAVLFNEWYKLRLYDVHKSKCHYDGEKCFGGGYFIVTASLPQGIISYHYPLENWDLFDIPKADRSKYPYDGHTSHDIINRLLAIDYINTLDNIF